MADNKGDAFSKEEINRLLREAGILNDIAPDDEQASGPGDIGTDLPQELKPDAPLSEDDVTRILKETGVLPDVDTGTSTSTGTDVQATPPRKFEYEDTDDPVEIKQRRLDIDASIDPSQQYPVDESGVMKMLTALDYAGNTVRSGIYGALDPNESAFGMMGQALRRERQITPGMLGNKMGLRDLSLKEGEFDIGDIPDFVRDVSIGVVTDPLTWMLGPITKGAQALAGVPKAIRGLGPGAKSAIASAGKVGGRATDLKIVADVAKAQAVSRGVAAGATGVVAGAGVEGDMMDKAAAATLATAGVLAGGAVAKAVGAPVKKKVVEAVDSLVDHVRAIRLGEGAIGGTAAARMARELDQKTQAVAQYLINMRLRALEGLTDAEKAEVHDVMQKYLSKTIDAREQAKAGSSAFNDLLQKEANLSGLITEGGSPDQLKDWTKQLDETRRLKNIHFNTMTEEIQKKRFNPNLVIANLVRQEKHKVAEAVKLWTQGNEEFIRMMNREVYGEVSGKWNRETGKGIAGLTWHIDNPNYKPSRVMSADLSQEADNLYAVHQKTMGTRHDVTKAMDRDTSYAIYAANRAKSWANAEEKQAMMKLTEIAGLQEKLKGTPGYNSALAKAGRGVLDGYDWLSKRAKDNMLALSVSWIKNNFYDNVLKAYMENGVVGAVDAATLGSLHKGLMSDIRGFSSKNAHAYLSKNPHTEDMIKYGVLNNNFFSRRAEDIAEFFYSPEQVAKMRDGKGIAATINKTLDAVAKPGYTIGGWVEDSAKAVTFINTKEALLKTGMSSDMASQLAAKVVKDTFFDYKNVHAVEQAVAKRVIPFWTFYSRNAVYWGKRLSTAEGLGRFALVEHGRKAIGARPTSEEIKGIPEYNLQAPRIVPADDPSDMGVMSFPNTSAYDALSTLTGSGGMRSPEYIEKMNPLLKSAYETTQGRDVFFGAPLYPHEYVKMSQKKGYAPTAVEAKGKSAGTSGYLKADLEEYLAAKDVPVPVRQLLGTYGYVIDQDTGKPRQMVDRDIPMVPKPLEHVVGTALGNLVPNLPFQLYGAYKKGQLHPEQGADPLLNLVAPWRVDTYKPEEVERTASFKRR